MEKVTKIIINILKISSILIVLTIIISLFSIWCREHFIAKPVGTMITMECTINGNKYTYEIKDNYSINDSIFSFITNDKDLKLNYKDYGKLEGLIKYIKKDVVSRGRTCTNDTLLTSNSD